ncbi:MAG: hypothetical protein GY793_05310 [Proteobacteria bacterium]|nr:hypothetical protein [Pseudomonadota bacterium]
MIGNDILIDFISILCTLLALCGVIFLIVFIKKQYDELKTIRQQLKNTKDALDHASYLLEVSGKSLIELHLLIKEPTYQQFELDCDDLDNFKSAFEDPTPKEQIFLKTLQTQFTRKIDGSKGKLTTVSAKYILDLWGSLRDETSKDILLLLRIQSALEKVRREKGPLNLT